MRAHYHKGLTFRYKENDVIRPFFDKRGRRIPEGLRSNVCDANKNFRSGLDTSIAMVMYPDILARNRNTPGLNLAALQWMSTDYSLSFFVAEDDELNFTFTGRLASAYDVFSSGLLFLG